MLAGPKSVFRVALVEDERITRESLRRLLESSDRCKVAGAYGCMEDALEGIATELPDVVVLDIGLPGMTGIEGIHILRDRYPHLSVLVLSVYDDEDRVFDAICAGASGYLLKTTPLAGLLQSIDDVMEGGAPMSPRIARRVLQLFRGMRPPERGNEALSPHEIRLLKMLAEGHTYRSAASQLGVTTHTVSFHLRNLYDKLQAHSKAEAVSKALRCGILR